MLLLLFIWDFVVASDVCYSLRSQPLYRRKGRELSVLMLNGKVILQKAME